MVQGAEATERIVKLLQVNPKGAGITEIARKVKMHRNVVSKYLELLLVSGQVEVRRAGMAKIYTLSERVPVSAMLAFDDDLLVVVDEAGRIVRANEAFLAICGKDRNEVLGCGVEGSDLPILSDREILADILEGTGRRELIREVHGHSGNTTQYYRVRLIPSVFEEGRPGMTMIAVDVTSQKESEHRLEVSEARYRAVVDLQQDLICRFLPDFTLTFCNRSFRDYFGIPEPVSGTFLHTVHEADRSLVEALVRSLDHHEFPTVREHRAPSGLPDKSRSGNRWNRWTYDPIYNCSDEITEIQATGRDITHEKELESRGEHFMHDVEFLSGKALEFAELPIEMNVYDAIGRGVETLVRDAVIATSSFDPETQSITVRSFLGDRDGIFAKHFRDMIGLTMPILDHEVISLMSSGRLHEVPGKVYITTFGQIPLYSAFRIEEELPLASIYSIGIAARGKLMGVATMFLRSSDTVQNPELVEAYIRQATLALQRRLVEDTGSKSEERWQAISE